MSEVFQEVRRRRNTFVKAAIYSVACASAGSLLFAFQFLRLTLTPLEILFVFLGGILSTLGFLVGIVIVIHAVKQTRLRNFSNSSIYFLSILIVAGAGVAGGVIFVYNPVFFSFNPASSLLTPKASIPLTFGAVVSSITLYSFSIFSYIIYQPTLDEIGWQQLLLISLISMVFGPGSGYFTLFATKDNFSRSSAFLTGLIIVLFVIGFVCMDLFRFGSFSQKEANQRNQQEYVPIENEEEIKEPCEHSQEHAEVVVKSNSFGFDWMMVGLKLGPDRTLLVCKKCGDVYYAEKSWLSRIRDFISRI